MATFIVVVVALLGGVAGAVQSQAMGLMTGRAGAAESVFLTYASGGIAIGLIMVALQGGNLGALRGVPPWVYGAGLLGLVVVGSIGISAAHLGLARTMTLFTAASLAVGAAVDHFGWLGATHRLIDGGRVLGLVLVLVGTWLVTRG